MYTVSAAAPAMMNRGLQTEKPSEKRNRERLRDDFHNAEREISSFVFERKALKNVCWKQKHVIGISIGWTAPPRERK